MTAVMLPASEAVDAPPPWDINSIRAVAKANPDLSREDIGNRVTARLSKADLRTFAVEYVARWVDAIRRWEARKVEERCAPVQVQPTTVGAAPVAPEPRGNLPDRPWYVGNAARRARFRKSMGEEEFAAWYARMQSLIGESGDEDDLEMFAEDWWPGGVRARQRHVAAQALHRLIADMAEKVRLETTQELLATVFALGDGERVTWGEATREQHQQRIAMLVGNAAGNVETAARHQAAIRMIDDSGVKRLADLAVVAR